MLTTFIAANIPFKVCILDFENNLNAHDTNTAKEICRRHQIIPEIKTIDIIDFYESPRFLEYAKASSCSSPQVVVHCYLADQINGVPVFGGDFFYFHNELVYFNKPPNSIQLPHYKDFAIDRFLRRHGRFGVGHFLNYTSELIHSFLQYTRAARSHTYDNSSITTRYDFKQAIYRDGGFQFAQYPERTFKQTGFEKVKDVFAEKNKDGWAYEKLYRYPLEQLYGKTEKVFLVLKKDNHFMAKLLKEMADVK
ncbi:hypothetical protein [Pseudobdellovibrio exovorus]|nr:hypothetical protein [Pseudobdellovibrio exovorus]